MSLGPAGAPQVATNPVDAGAAAEQAAFNAAMRADTEEALSAFLQSHPSGPLADIARRERDRLSKQAALTPIRSAPAPASTKPILLAAFGDWSAYVARTGDEKNCYIMSLPHDRIPAVASRGRVYAFISERPTQNVKNEVAFILGFQGNPDGAASAAIDGQSFDLALRDDHAYVKNEAQQPSFVAAAREGSILTVRTPNPRGSITIDTYSLTGFSQALDRMTSECN